MVVFLLENINNFIKIYCCQVRRFNCNSYKLCKVTVTYSLRSRILTNSSWLKERSTVAVPTGRVSKMRLIPRTDQETFILGWSGSGDDTKGWEGNERGRGHRVGGGTYMFLPPPPQPKILYETLTRLVVTT